MKTKFEPRWCCDKFKKALRMKFLVIKENDTGSMELVFNSNIHPKNVEDIPTTGKCNPPDWTISMEIEICPFCGKKIDWKIKPSEEIHLLKCRGCSKVYPDKLLGLKTRWCPFCGGTSQNTEEKKIIEYEQLEEIIVLNVQ